MEKSLPSFIRALGEDQNLRKKYRSDPMIALRDYGIAEISMADIEIFSKIPQKTVEDMEAFVKILELIANEVK